jgi:carbamoyl-phosphate synthase large subunit
MPSGQSSTPTIAKSVHNNTVNLVAYHGILALDPKATGIFCVDLKENEEGVPCITEINAGRFFTTSNFFAEAGSNMPYYYVKMAYGEEIPDLPQFNAVPEGLYWVRGMDMEQVMVKEDELS